MQKEDSPKGTSRVPGTVVNVHRAGKRCATGNSPGLTVLAQAGPALEESRSDPPWDPPPDRPH